MHGRRNVKVYNMHHVFVLVLVIVLVAQVACWAAVADRATIPRGSHQGTDSTPQICSETCWKPSQAFEAVHRETLPWRREAVSNRLGFCRRNLAYDLLRWNNDMDGGRRRRRSIRGKKANIKKQQNNDYDDPRRQACATHVVDDG